MWVKIDDGFTQHPKIIGLTDRAFRSYMEGLCYSAQYLTDGYLPRGFLAGQPDAADELQRAGLWIVGENGGVVIHDFLEWNPPSGEVRQRALERSEARKRAGQVRAKSAQRNGDGTYSRTSSPAHPAPHPAQHPAPTQQQSSPEPEPEPEPQSIDKPSRTKGLLRVNDRQMYLLSRLQQNDDAWEAITPAALVKLGKQYGMDAVTTALGYCREELPADIRSPYAYLRKVVAEVVREREAAV